MAQDHESSSPLTVIEWLITLAVVGVSAYMLLTG